MNKYEYDYGSASLSINFLFAKKRMQSLNSELLLETSYSENVVYQHSYDAKLKS